MSTFTYTTSIKDNIIDFIHNCPYRDVNKIQSLIQQKFGIKLHTQFIQKYIPKLNNFNESQSKKKYNFNVFGMFAAGFHKKIGKEYSFYCAEFVKYVLEQSFNKKLLPEIVKPMDFLELNNLELVYEGIFREYNNSKECAESM